MASEVVTCRAGNHGTGKAFLLRRPHNSAEGPYLQSCTELVHAWGSFTPCWFWNKNLQRRWKARGGCAQQSETRRLSSPLWPTGGDTDGETRRTNRLITDTWPRRFSEFILTSDFSGCATASPEVSQVMVLMDKAWTCRVCSEGETLMNVTERFGAENVFFCYVDVANEHRQTHLV